jgi:hypothetical protein
LSSSDHRGRNVGPRLRRGERWRQRKEEAMLGVAT